MPRPKHSILILEMAYCGLPHFQRLGKHETILKCFQKPLSVVRSERAWKKEHVPFATQLPHQFLQISIVVRKAANWDVKRKR